MNKAVLQAITGASFNPLSLSPILWIKDFSVINNGYYVDSSGNNIQCQAATTTVANDSIIMPANNTLVINALKKAHKYYQFYTSDSVPNKVLLSNLSIASINQYYEKEGFANFLIFSDKLSDINDNLVLKYLKYTKSYTTVIDKTFTDSTGWTLYSNTGNYCEILNGKLHEKKTTSNGSSFANVSHIYTIGDYIRVSAIGLDVVSQGGNILIGNGLTVNENANNYIFDMPTSGNYVIDNLSTISQVASTNYVGITLTPKPVGAEINLTSFKLEKITYTYNPNAFSPDYFDNSITYSLESDYIIKSAKSEFSFTTDSTFLSIKGKPTIASSYPNWAYISVYVNDSFYSNLKIEENKYSFLKLLEGTKKITLIESGLSKPSSTLIGCFLQKIKLRKGASFIPVHQTIVSEKYCFLGDSIMIGANATYLQDGFGGLIKKNNNKDVVILGWGYGRLSEFASNSTLINDTVSKIVASLSNATKKIFVCQLGTNDFGLDSLPSATFLSYYNSLIEAIHASDPSIKIYLLSPFARANDSKLIKDYRTGISNIATTHNNYCTYIDGYSAVTYNSTNFSVDGVHLLDAGHIVAYNYIYPIISA